MKVAYCSDLHLEFSAVDHTLFDNIDAKVLILAGDILIAEDIKRHPHPSDVIPQKNAHRLISAKEYFEFLDFVTTKFSHVLYVSGNHEAYDCEIEHSHSTLSNLSNEYPNFVYLNDSTIVIDGVQFVGGTLWTDLNKADPLTVHAVADMMNDYKNIRLANTNKFLSCVLASTMVFSFALAAILLR